MPTIDVTCKDSSDGWTCEVDVSDQTQTTHTVTVPEDDFNSLVGSEDATVDDLVEASFRFLLEREPQSAIMGQFDIMTIESYFSEYSDTIQSKL
jgi:hypothetical protein